MSYSTTYQNWNNRTVRETIMMPSPGAGTPAMTAVGDVPSIFGTFTVPTPILGDGVLGDFQAAAFANSQAGFLGDPIYIRGFDIGAYIRFKLLQTTNCRIFIGFSDQSASHMVSSDSPTGNYFGIQYSTSRGDTTFQIAYNDGTGMRNNAFIPVDTISHDLYLNLFSSSGSNACNAQIDNNTQNNDIIGTIPNNSTPLSFIAAIETFVASTASIRIGKVSIKQSA